MSKLFTVQKNYSPDSKVAATASAGAYLQCLAVALLLTLALVSSEAQAALAAMTRNSSLLCSIQEDPFAEVKKTLKDPSEACSANYGAKFEETCVNIWGHIGRAVKTYEQKKKSKCGEISRFEREADRCLASDEATQKNCLETAANKLKQAAESERALAKDLEEAKKEVEKRMKEAEVAQDTYSKEFATMETALNEAEKKEQALLQDLSNPNVDPNVKQGLGYQLNEVRMEKTRASGISGTDLMMGQTGQVVAQNGGAATIREYHNKAGSLIDEQIQARDSAESFVSSAGSSIEKHNQRAADLERQAATLMSRVEGSVTASDKYSQGQSLSRTGSSSLSKASPGNTSGSSDPSKTSVSDDSKSDPASSASKSPAGSMGGFSPAAPAGAGGSGGTNNSFPPLTGPGTGITSGSTSNSNKLGSDNNTNQGMKNDPLKAGGSTEFAGLPEGTVPTSANDYSAGSTSPGSSEKGNTAAARQSSAKGSREVSSSGSSMMNFGSGSSQKGTEGKGSVNLKGFEPNLEAGGTGILGSEVANAIDDLSSEFGLTESQGLTQSEMDAFASLDSKGLSQGSLDEASDSVMPGSETQPLFFRTREAHNRAIKRGNLMTTVKTRL